MSFCHDWGGMEKLITMITFCLSIHTNNILLKHGIEVGIVIWEEQE